MSMSDRIRELALGLVQLRRYQVWCPEYGQSADGMREIEAMDEGAAATAWAEKTESEDADYPIANGNEVVVRVRDVATGAETAFVVSGEVIPSYSATRMDEQSNA